MIVEFLSSLALVGAGFFALVAALGLVRFRDLASRMHAATKASGAAFALALLAMCLRMPGLEIVVKSAVALGFAFLTLPVAAHLLGRSAVRRPEKASSEGRQPEPGHPD